MQSGVILCISIFLLLPAVFHYNMDTKIPLSGLSDAPIPLDLVTVTVHDKSGNLKHEEQGHNIITGAGAIWFCIQQNRCSTQMPHPTSVGNVATPTWWVQFISGTANSNEPTGSDCTSPSGGGDLKGITTGSLNTLRCVTQFGSSSAQYQSTGSIISVSLTSGTAQLRTTTGNVDTTNNFAQTTAATVCSVVNDGTAPSSSTCQFSDSTQTFTNQSGSAITVNGLALASGTTSNSVAGPLIIAEATITPVTLQPGDTISVTWTVVV